MTPPSHWIALETAAAHLDETPKALLRRIARVAQRMPDGAIEANLDGIRARKLGKLWKVRLSEGWIQ